MLETDNVELEIMIQCQKKLGIVSEIYRLTQEIDQLLAVNDRGSTQLVLVMRQEEMEKADQCSEAIAYLRESMEDGKRQHFAALLDQPDGGKLAETPQEKKIIEISKQIQHMLEKTVELDKHLNQRIAGKDSFYNQKK